MCLTMASKNSSWRRMWERIKRVSIDGNARRVLTPWRKRGRGTLIHPGQSHCPACGKVFGNDSKLRIHIIEQHPSMRSTEVRLNNLSAICKYLGCGCVVLADFENLQAHLKERHGLTQMSGSQVLIHFKLPFPQPSFSSGNLPSIQEYIPKNGNLQSLPPLASHETVCPYCNNRVGRRNLERHIALRCPHAPPEIKAVRPAPKAQHTEKRIGPLRKDYETGVAKVAYAEFVRQQRDSMSD